MNKKFTSIILLCTLTISAAIAPITAFADDYSSQIEQKNSELASIQTQEQEAQAQVDALQSKVDSITAKMEELKAENAKLEAEKEKFNTQVAKLNTAIEKRNETIVSQARNIQTNGSGTNLLDVVMGSKSLSEAVSRIQAMNKLNAANKDLLQQQMKDKEALQAKITENAKQTKIIWDNQANLTQQQKDLADQQAQLKAAQLGLQATRAKTTSERDSLVAKQQEAQIAAQKLAQEQAAQAQAQKAAQKLADEAAKKAADEATQKLAQEQQNNVNAQSEVSVPTPSPAAPSQPDNNNSANNNTVASTDDSSSNNNNSGSTDNSSSNNNSGGSTDNNNSSNNNVGGGNVGGQTSINPYPAGQCTAFVWQYFHDMGVPIQTYMGNAGDWVVYANSGAAAGTIVVFPPAGDNGGYGHVAVVTSVNGDGTMNIIEGNYLGIWGHTRTVSISSASGFIRP
ncbi:MAG: CHAP domain-containing protein [Streptococcaceae bacterium]|jgi:peptidoglycan hydrolase CwlO-like protein/surface antigen|nr:CHAP domain-containing protein [Streptococcaceae bacterium]